MAVFFPILHGALLTDRNTQILGTSYWPRLVSVTISSTSLAAPVQTQFKMISAIASIIPRQDLQRTIPNAGHNLVFFKIAIVSINVYERLHCVVHYAKCFTFIILLCLQKPYEVITSNHAHITYLATKALQEQVICKSPSQKVAVQVSNLRPCFFLIRPKPSPTSS